MLTAEEIRAALARIDGQVATWVLAHVANGHALEAQRLLCSQVSPAEYPWATELVASLARQHVRMEVAR